MRLFDDAVRQWPDAIAMEWQGGQLSFRQLDERANALAGRLLELGVGPDVVVGIYMERSAEALLSLLAVLKAGGGYLPLDPAYPIERLNFMLGDAAPSVLITTPLLEGRLASHEAQVVHPDDSGPAVVGSVAANDENLAYLIYTSGSTGRPKGVEMPVGPLRNLLHWQLRHSRGGRTLQFAPLSFDVHFQELFATWAAGDTVVLVDEDLRTEVGALLDFLVARRVQRLFLPFVALQQLADAARDRQLWPTSLREVVSAGEQLQCTDSIRELFRHLPGATLSNQYGPSETHVVTALTLGADPADWEALPAIGVPIDGAEIRLLDEQGKPVVEGQQGEICIGGPVLARGYRNRPELTAERFITSVDGWRYYRSGDLGGLRGDGNFQYLGRLDDQVKVRGFRIELGEVEVSLTAHPEVSQAAVSVLRRDSGADDLIAHIVPQAGDSAPSVSELRRFLAGRLPDYMVPGTYVAMDSLPRTPSGKVDRRALPAPGSERPAVEAEFVAPGGGLAERIAAVWREILGIDQVGVNDNFFDLGGNSLLALRVAARLRQDLQRDLPIMTLFESPTIAALARQLGDDDDSGPDRFRASGRTGAQGGHADIAVIGMAGRFPGAPDVDALWDNLSSGRESVTFFKDEELDPRVDASQPGYVKARGIIEDADKYDAAFFHDNPRQAEVIDPQQRVLLEVAWHALEDAGVAPADYPGAIGVFAGVGNNSYYPANLATRPDRIRAVGEFVTMVANEKDYVATRIAHKLDLTGPALSIHTACSTSLVSVVSAVESLRAGSCDVALAGGAAVTVPQYSGHLYTEGAMLSPDGHCRPFDAEAGGTLFSDGAGMVVLKRLDEALADGDRVYGVVRGVASNNDGAHKASFTAPSIEGQVGVISAAQADGGIDPASIGYVEAHGTATPLGDPIEVEALTRAFRQGTGASGFCALGSIKSNFGHLTAAAGVAGFIKSALCLHHRRLVPSLHFKRPNPQIDFEHSPFFVNTESRDWSAGEHPRRAAISAFGVGGTNAHVILEEPPAEPAADAPSRDCQLLLLSADGEDGLEQVSGNMADFLRAGAQAADAAFSSQLGRTHLPQRRFAVGCGGQALAEAIARGPTRRFEGLSPEVALLFPGQGAQYVGMGSGLYGREPIFSQALERVLAALPAEVADDVRSVLLEADDDEDSRELLRQTRVTQPALYAVEYALAEQWRAWGIRPGALAGHSVGEFVAATVAGVMSPESGAGLVAARGALIQALPAGGMLSVRAPAAQIEPRLPAELSLAAANSPRLCVVSGPTPAIEAFAAELQAEGLPAKPLHTSHAFHSAMMEPAVEPLRKLAAAASLVAPRIPIVSTVSGTWMTDEQATDPDYWSRHLRRTVRFNDAVNTLWQEPTRLLLEAGPRNTAATLARQAMQDRRTQVAVSSLADQPDREQEAMLGALGQLWLSGVQPDWHALYVGERRRRLSLPAYPFRRSRCWVEPGEVQASAAIGEPVPVAEAAVPDTSTTTVGEPVARLPRLVTEITALVEDASGLDVESVSDSFMEQGLDSLILTQLAISLSQHYGLEISFRQLMEDHASVEALAAHIDGQLPPEEAPLVSAAPPPAAAAAASSPTAADGDVLGQILAQLEQLRGQVAQLQGGATAMPAAIAAPRVTAAPEPGVEASEPPAPKARAHGPGARIETRASDDLLPSQQLALEAFAEAYIARTPASRDYVESQRGHFADPRVVSGFRPQVKEMVYPIVVDRSAGARMWDIDGNEYIDITCGFGADYFGHRPPEVMAAIQEQMQRGIEIGPQHPLAGTVAAQICAFTGAERAALCNTGSEAVLGALRLARTVTGRSTVVAFEGAYHGIFDEVIVRPTKKGHSLPAAAGIPRSHVEDILVLPYGESESLRVIEERGAEIAAVLVEPVQSRRPALQPREFLHELRAITEQTGSALIFDEVITGFRIRPGGAQEYFGVQADIGTYGKILGGGMPIAAIAGRRRFLDALDGGEWHFGDDSYPQVGVTYFAGTFVRHPPALAAAHAALALMQREGPALQERVNALADDLVARLNAVFSEAGVDMHVDSCGSLWKLKVGESLPHGYLFYWWLRHHGLHVWEDRPLFVTTAHVAADIDAIVAAFARSVEEMQAVGLLPGGEQAGRRVATTPAQREIWAAAQLGEGANLAYNESVALRLRGPLDIQRLARVFPEAVARHEALRARFDADGAEWEPASGPTPELSISDRQIPADAAESAIREIGLHEVSTPFDLVNGPLMRARLYALGKDDHLLSFSAHHIVCDGWSSTVFLHDLGRLYGGRDTAPAFPFSEYVLSQQGRDFLDRAEQARDYWRSVYRQPAPVLELPVDGQRPPLRGFDAERLDHPLDNDLTNALKKMAAQRGVSYFSLLMAAFATLLHRITGQQDLVIGVPSAGQATSGEHFLVGHCVNLLPILTRVEGDKAFSSYLDSLKGQVIEAYNHHQLSFGTLLGDLDVPRDPSRVPLVSVMFNYDKGVDDVAFEGLEMEFISFPRNHEAFEMFVNVSEANGRTVVECQYNTALFSHSAIGHRMREYESLLRAVLASPDGRVDELDLLDADGGEHPSPDLNPPASDFPAVSVPALFEARAGAEPGRLALVCEGRELRYGELERAANRLAAHLRELGAGPGRIVAIALPRSVEMPLAVLAVLKSGAAYLPLAVDHPRERLAYILDDAGADLMISMESLLDSLPEFDGQVVCLDRDRALIESRPDSPGEAVAPTGLAYLIYTSGSTGRPKGVEIPHSAVVNFLTSMAREPGLGPDDTLVAVTTLSFDISVLELLLPLSVGARCVVASQAETQDGRRLAGLLDTHQASVFQATPASYRMLLQGGWSGRPGLRLLCGGEALPRELIAPLLERCGELWNMYGPTETTVWSTCARVTDPQAIVSIGRPIANTRVYLLDERLQPVPPGVRGQLYIGGAGLARGYHGRPELTAERFIASPFEAGERLYATGDWVHLREDSGLIFDQRLDTQVKLRGFRIELGEIESLLAALPAIRQAVCAVREDQPGDQRLVAYLVAEAGTDAQTLREGLRSNLPEYMVPQHFVFLQDLPLGSSGKVDRRALPAPETTRVADEAPPELVLSDSEGQVAGLWRELTGETDIRPDDMFMDIGGNSLLAIQFIEELHRLKGVRLDLGAVFLNTLRQLAAELERQPAEPQPGAADAKKSLAGRLRAMFR